MSVALNMITGPFDEPFIKAAVDSSLELIDEMVFVDTAPGNNPSRPYLDYLADSCVMPVKIVDMPRGEDKDFSFAKARDLARENSSSKWCLRLDADEVIHEDDIADILIAVNIDMYKAIEVSFYHHMVYPWLFQYTESKIILFQKDFSHWTRGVHELINVNGQIHRLPTVKYHHYGYCRGQAEVFKRWQLYVDIDGRPNWYSGRDPENIITDRIAVCQRFEGKHPKYVLPILHEMFPEMVL